MLIDLQVCQTRADFASLLDVPVKELTHTLFKVPDASKYSSFCISKKNGGTRHILAPCSPLKWLQRRLLSVLYQCEDDIEAARGRSSNLHFGFRRGLNIYDNAYVHRGKRHTFNIDIADFFDQINFGRVRVFFIKDHRFRLQEPVATVIAQIACFNKLLPQGSPTSPHIANLVSQFFDNRMTRFLRPQRCRYTRYADDITISTDLRDFPQTIATNTGVAPQGWEPTQALRNIFARAGFAINDSKTRMSTHGSRQSVTGLVVNDRPNVTREYYLQTRAMCDHLFKNGTFVEANICDGFGENCPAVEPIGEPAPSSPLMALEGRLSHIHYIRERSDSRTIQKKQDEPTQFWCMLQRFYLFKYFVANPRPVILTEGPSDISHLRSAILHSATLFDNLASVKNGTRTIVAHFFRFDGNASQVIGLTGGSGNIKRFLYLYNKSQKLFNQSLRHQPVIIVVDNDKGVRTR
ncbi:MAG TPA: retron Ec67 family RNA-directed DNA polymerase/endonuclease [Sphingomonadaceae bacterium]|nr:retron Ec67 family RNA-directed DNA polymerase/endonuclease [Sphingomonadaceae bacterium]